MSATDDELREAAERYESWAIWGGIAVIAAVFVEVPLILWPLESEGLQQLCEASATFVIALGVAAEVLFGKRASRRQGELLERSGNKLAEALERATNAQLALEQYRAQRGLSPEGQKQVAAALTAFSGAVFEVAITRGDSECNRCSKTIEEALRMAGFVQISWSGKGDVLTRKEGPTVGEIMGVGIFLEVHGEKHPELVPIAEAVAKALTDAGVETVAFPKVISSAVNDHTVHLHVGQKA